MVLAGTAPADPVGPAAGAIHGQVSSGLLQIPISYREQNWAACSGRVSFWSSVVFDRALPG